jgi:hypothetical protein
MAETWISPCEYARQRHHDLVRWRNLWTILLFAFGSAIVLFLIAAIILFLRASWLPAAISTLGTIASGMGIKWVVDRRTEAVQEEEAAYKDVAEKCKDSRTADELRARFRLFGRIL